jgi:hypothetical protein
LCRILFFPPRQLRCVISGTYREDISALGYVAAMERAPLTANPYLTTYSIYSLPSTSCTTCTTPFIALADRTLTSLTLGQRIDGFWLSYLILRAVLTTVSTGRRDVILLFYRPKSHGPMCSHITNVFLSLRLAAFCQSIPHFLIRNMRTPDQVLCKRKKLVFFCLPRVQCWRYVRLRNTGVSQRRDQDCRGSRCYGYVWSDSAHANMCPCAGTRHLVDSSSVFLRLSLRHHVVWSNLSHDNLRPAA